MKPLFIFLPCLALVAVFNLALDVRQRATWQTSAPLFTQIEPSQQADSVFEERLAAVTAPTELRMMARVQYAKRLDSNRLTMSVFGSCLQMNSAAILRSVTLLVLSLCTLAAGLWPRRTIIRKPSFVAEDRA